VRVETGQTELTYFPHVAALVSHNVFPISIEERERELVYWFQRTPDFQSIVARSQNRTLEVNRALYDAALNVCRENTSPLPLRRATRSSE
jgi:hypothetical protein